MESLTITPPPNERAGAPFSRVAMAVLILVLWGLATLLQVRNGVYASDVGADPDEPAHVVTSLMMRDYLTTGLLHGEHPMHFAQRYYDHFPKVAIGHYPPGFYLVAGAWLLPWASNTSLMILMGLLTALLGATTAWLAVRCRLPRGVAVVAGAWVVLLPLTQKQSMLVMSDLLLATGCLLAIQAFAAFMDRPAAGRALLFGLFAAASILTKASAVALALIPVAGIVALGRWSLLWNWRLWLAPVPVVATALPWTLLTMHITEEGMQNKSVAEYFPEAVQFYTAAFGYTFGPVLLAGALVALIAGLRSWWRGGPERCTLAVLLAVWVPCLLALYLVSPTGTSARYLLPMVPSLVIAAVWAFAQVQRLWKHRAAGVVACVLAALASVLLLEKVPPKQTQGFGLIAGELTRRAQGGRVLVSSDARGEGGLIAELALRSPRRVDSPWTVVRASKFAASSNWTGSGYQLAFADVAQLNTAMLKDGIDWVVVDRDVPSYYLAPHHAQMKQWEAAGHTPVMEARVMRHLEPAPGVLVLYSNPAKP